MHTHKSLKKETFVCVLCFLVGLVGCLPPFDVVIDGGGFLIALQMSVTLRAATVSRPASRLAIQQSGSQRLCSNVTYARRVVSADDTDPCALAHYCQVFIGPAECRPFVSLFAKKCVCVPIPKRRTCRHTHGGRRSHFAASTVEWQIKYKKGHVRVTNPTKVFVRLDLYARGSHIVDSVQFYPLSDCPSHYHFHQFETFCQHGALANSQGKLQSSCCCIESSLLIVNHPLGPIDADRRWVASTVSDGNNQHRGRMLYMSCRWLFHTRIRLFIVNDGVVSRKIAFF